MTRVNVKIWDTTHKKLSEFAETKETSIAEVIDKAVTRYMGHISDKTEIQQLKLEIERLKNVGASQPRAEISPMGHAPTRAQETPPQKEVVAQEAMKVEDAPSRLSQSPQRTAGEVLHQSRSGVPPEELKPSLPASKEPTLPFGASQTSRPALTDTSEPSKSGDIGTIQLSQKQQAALVFERERLQLRVAAARTIEQEKRETARQTQFRKPQRQPVQDDISTTFAQPCPLGYSPNYCVHSVGQCERRGQCHRDGILKGPTFKLGDNPQPFKGDLAYVQ